MKFLFNKKKQPSARPFPSDILDKEIPVSDNLENNKQQLQEIMGESPDVVLHSITIADKHKTREALLFWIDGMVDEQTVREHILESILKEELDTPGDGLERIKKRIYAKKAETESDLTEGVKKVLSGAIFLLVDGYSEGISIHAEAFELRGIEEPASESVVRGSREGFVESSGINMSLLRRRIQHPSLRFENLSLGTYTRTQITMAYIEGIVNPEFPQQVKDKLQQIKTDSITSSGELEQYLEDFPYSLFPTIGNTERPDRAAGLLLEGRVVLLINGDPVSLYAPYLFLEAFQNIEDYSSRPYYASLIRFLRIFAYFFSITLPSVFIAALNFHKEMIPSELIVSMAEAREKVPFPLVMEVVLMIVMFEIVREAGVRMPKPIGQAVSIVGALILGSVSVEAGLVGAPTIIVVALSVISAFVITPIADVTGVIRLALIIPTSLFGLYGLFPAMLGILTHMVSLSSLGVPYLAPFAPLHLRDWKDSLVRFPWHLTRERPKSIPNQRSVRIKQLPVDRKKNP